MADFTGTGFQANVNAGTGSGVSYLDPVTGQYVESSSTRGQQIQRDIRNRVTQSATKQVADQRNLATAEVEADAQNYEAEQNRAQGQQAFQLALSQAGGRRAPGGGIARGGSGRRGMSIGAATGGLAAANAAARRSSQMKLAQARVTADPTIQRLETGLSRTPTGPRLTPSGQAIFKK